MYAKSIQNIIYTIFCITILSPLLIYSNKLTTDNANITIDGLVSTNENYVSIMDRGEDLESDRDSYWGENEEIKDILVTWDNKYFYIAIEVVCSGNSLIVLFDVNNRYDYDNYYKTGMTTMKDLNAWKRNISFSNGFQPSFFLTTWDIEGENGDNNVVQAWRAYDNYSATQRYDLDGKENMTQSFFKSRSQFLEARIPVNDQLFDRNGLQIRIAAVITQNEDGKSGPDAAPNNSAGVYSDSNKEITLDNYIAINVDSNNDGLFDTGVNPLSVSSLAIPLPFIQNELKLLNFKVYPKAFSPNNDKNNEYTNISFEISREEKISLEIFDINGNLIKELYKDKVVEEGTVDYKKYNKMFWNGRNESNNIAPFGLYIVRVTAGNIRINKAVALIK